MAVNVEDYILYVVNIYGPCYLVDKRRGWEELKNLKDNYASGEWCLVGDFNAVTSVEERKGRNGEGITQEIIDFNCFIVDMELFDVSVTGNDSLGIV